MTTTPMTPATGAGLLERIYASPGPYVSLYMATSPDAEAAAEADRRWSQLRRDLEEHGAHRTALDAVAQRLSLPVPQDTAATAVIAAADGTCIVDHGMEPPHVDYATVDTLPYAAPLLEWHQRRVPHLVVMMNGSEADIISFGADHKPAEVGYTDGADVVDRVLTAADAIRAQLVVVAGPASHSEPLAHALSTKLPISCRVVAEPGAATTEDLVDATVRWVSDTAARRTVGLLRELRFLESHEEAVDGSEDTVDALRSGTANVLLVHDDPSDERRVWIGARPDQISLVEKQDHRDEARLVDAAIRSAILQRMIVHIIPSTGAKGPDGDIATMERG